MLALTVTQILGHFLSINNWFPLIQDFNPKYYLFYVGINDAVIIHQNKRPKNQITNKNTNGVNFNKTDFNLNSSFTTNLKNTFFE